MRSFSVKSVRARLGEPLVTLLSLVRDTQTLGGKRNSPSDSCGRGRGKEKERRHEDRSKESEDEKNGGSKDSKTKTGTLSKSEVCRRCGDSGHKMVKCPDQICSVCGGKGHAPEINLCQCRLGLCVPSH